MIDPKEQVVSQALCRNHLSGFAEVCVGVCGGCTIPGQPHPCEHALTVWRSDAQEILRALLAGEGNSVAAGSPPIDPWQPIATAPKDELIDIWIKNSDGTGTRWADCYYDHICSQWRTSRPSGHLVCVSELAVTHWMPSAAPPEADIAGEKAGVTQASDSLARPSSSPSPAVRDGHLREAATNLSNFAWTALTADEPAAGEYLNTLLADLRAALSSAPPVRDVTLREALEVREADMAIARSLEGKLCSDCPPAAFPDAPTRCLDCPRRRDALDLRHQAKRLADDAEKYLVTMHQYKCDPDSWYSIRVETAITAVRRALSHPSAPDGGKP